MYVWVDEWRVLVCCTRNGTAEGARLSGVGVRVSGIPNLTDHAVLARIVSEQRVAVCWGLAVEPKYGAWR